MNYIIISGSYTYVNCKTLNLPTFVENIKAEERE